MWGFKVQSVETLEISSWFATEAEAIEYGIATWGKSNFYLLNQLETEADNQAFRNMVAGPQNNLD